METVTQIPQIEQKIKHKFTTEDNDILIKYIKEYPTNLRYAFKLAAQKLNRSEGSISQHYYKNLKSAQLLITCGSSDGFSNNIKNVHKNKKTGVIDSNMLKPYQMILKDLLNLSEKDRNKILQIFV